MIDPNTALEAGAALVTAIGGLYGAVRAIIARSKRKREEHKQEVLAMAKAELVLVKENLESKIRKLELELETQKISISKDFDHFTEVYNNEIKSLGEKIENLREDLSQQHQALVGLLTKLVDR
jgi:hypothetical protein